jgi:hypothetical protein
MPLLEGGSYCGKIQTWLESKSNLNERYFCFFSQLQLDQTSCFHVDQDMEKNARPLQEVNSRDVSLFRPSPSRKHH